MADDRNQATKQASEPAAINQPPSGDQIHIAEELNDLEKEDRSQTFIVVGAVLLAIAVVIGLFAYALRPKPKATGTIDEAYAVALPGDNVLATVKVTFQNVGGKPIWIRNIKAQMTSPDGKEFKDEAANAVDFDRYFRGYPDLRDHSLQPLKVETKLAPGEQIRGSVIVSYPVTLDTFNNRKVLSVIIEPYDQPPVTITK